MARKMGNGTELSDTQLVMLSSAAQREDGLVVVPDRIKGAAATQVLGLLRHRGLIEEVAVGREQPSCGTDKAGRRVGFTITKAGRQAIGIEPESSAEDPEGRVPASAGVAARRTRQHRPPSLPRIRLHRPERRGTAASSHRSSRS